MEKAVYRTPEILIILLEQGDMICTSGGADNDFIPGAGDWEQ